MRARVHVGGGWRGATTEIVAHVEAPDWASTLGIDFQQHAHEKVISKPRRAGKQARTTMK